MREKRKEKREKMGEKREKRKEKRTSPLSSPFSLLSSLFSLFFSLLLCSTPNPLLAQELPNQCQSLRPTPMRECGEAAEFLCVNTPAGGVEEEAIIIKGRLNLESSTLASFSVSTQHEYTREIKNIELSEPTQENCWGQTLNAAANFCLEENGKYSVHVPLSELGPATILVTASPVQGSSMEQTVRTSRVIQPTFTADSISYEPDIAGPVPAETDHVRVTVDLLKGCEATEACDFIGASTGGVFVTVENEIRGEALRKIRCETNIPQTGPGQFVIGAPVQPGTNQLTVTVCNAVTGFDKSRCPKIATPSFQVGGQPVKIELLSPSNPLRFKVLNYSPETCDDSVRVTFNLEEPKSVCPNGEGIYQTALAVQEGYNIAAIEVNLSNQRLSASVVFASGNSLSPFTQGGELKPEEEWRLKEALQLGLSRALIQETFWSRLERYLNSNRFKTELGEWSESLGGEGETDEEGLYPAERKAILEELSYCPRIESENPLKMKMVRRPEIGRVEIKPLQFSAQKLKTTIKAKDVSLQIQLYKDEDNDGRPDIEPLPLKIAFEEVTMEPVFEFQGNGDNLLVKLSSPHTDCDYKRRGACFGFPALLVPQKFQGSANGAGAFAVCDRSQAISERMDEACHGLNVVDRQTRGVMQEKILDVLNRSYACNGSALLTALFRNGIPLKQEGEYFNLEGKVGLETIQVKEEGILFSLFSQFGSEEILRSWPRELRRRMPGILVNRGSVSGNVFAEEGIGIDLALPLISQLFWGLTNPEGGAFGLKMDEAFFRSQGFDFESRCASETPSPLCKLRPRAQEILGSVVTDYGYMSPTDPVTLTLKPSLAFPLRLKVVGPSTGSGQGKIRAELADWELEFASAEGSLIKAGLSFMVTLDVSPLTVGSEDPDHLRIKTRIVPEESRVWLVPKEETNTTVIPGTLLLSELEGKLKLTIDLFGQAGNEIKIPIPRFLTFPEESFFAKLGLQELTWGPDGIALDWNASANRLSIQLTPFFGE